MARKEEYIEFTRALIRVWIEVRTGDCVIKTHESHDLSMTGISLKQHVMLRFFWKELNLPSYWSVLSAHLLPGL
jgi:hypothetical protein